MMSQQIGDSISRKDVRHLIAELANAISDERCFMSRGRDASTIMQDIIGLPPVNQWIPVSERLPETTDNVLVSDSYHDVFVAWCQNRGGSRWWNSEDMKYSANVPILAWMPLPAPYKEESEDEK